jgi:hypothetical protein
MVLGQALARLPVRRALWAALLLAACFFVPLRNQWFDYGPIENWRQAANLVNTHGTDQDLLLLHPNFIRLTLAYYLDRNLPVAAIPSEFDPVHLKITTPKPLAPGQLDALTAVVRTHGRVWLIISRHNWAESSQVKKWLANQYGPPQTYAFNFIWVYLYTRAGEPEAAGR